MKKHARALIGALIAVVAVAIVLIITQTGGGGKPSFKVLGHPCSKTDTAMQCQLRELPSPPHNPGAALASGFSTQYGVDFAWSCPIASGSFGASYLSYDTSKNWSNGCVNAYHARGKTTVAVWETSASRATAGYSAGYSDALAARGQARALGMPENRPIDFAIDCDCTGRQVDSYFRGADAAIGVSRVDAYGGYTPVGYLCANHLVSGHSWQTYAWSGGRWLPASCAPLEQYNNDGSVDYDRAIGPDFAQWPYNTGPPPPPPDPHGFHYYTTTPYSSPFGKIAERNVAEHYVGARPHPKYAGYVRYLRRQCDYLANRLWTIVHRDRVVNWDKYNRGFRHYHLRLCAEGKPI